MELQKSANQGRRCTWEKLSAIKANCGIELALDECVAVLNHMRRLKRSAERAAAASSSHGLASTSKFNASKRIPSWNVIARENSTGSLEEDLMADVASPLHHGAYIGRNWRINRHTHDGSDSESESVDLNSWTRSGGPLMRTSSADKFIDFVQSLEVDARMSRGMMGQSNSSVIQIGGTRAETPDRTSSDTEYDQRDFSNIRAHTSNSSSIMVAEGDLLQPERIDNGIVFNVVKKSVLTPSNRSYDSEHNSSPQDSVAMQHDGFHNYELDASSVSESGDDVVGEDVFGDEDDSGHVPVSRSGDGVCDQHVMDG